MTNALSKVAQSEVLRDMSDGEIAKAAKLYQQQGRAMARQASELHRKADMLRNELRRRRAATEAISE